MRPPLVAVVAVVVLALGAGSARAADHPVVATNYSFSGSPPVITQGDTVTWTNGGGTHNVVFDDGTFTMPAAAELPAGWPPLVRKQFDAIGTFRYHCALHEGLGMSATVRVDAAPAAPPPGGPIDPGTPPPPPGGGGPGPGGSPEPLDPFKVKLSAGDRTPPLGKRVVLSGTVAPARDGRRLQIQRRLGGRWKTIATVTLKDAGSAKSKFSVRLKLSADAVLRARLAGDDKRSTGLSKRLEIDVHR